MVFPLEPLRSVHLRTVELALARYRLRFIHPFGTAHGLRDGTDAVFVRLTQEGRVGYGEATLPPYLTWTQLCVYEEIKSFWFKYGSHISSDTDTHTTLNSLCPPARSAFVGAFNELKHSTSVRSSAAQESGSCDRRPRARAMVTLGHSLVQDIAQKIKELPNAAVLKVKAGSKADQATIREVMRVDERPLFLDANQGWRNVDEALAAIKVAGMDRVVGVEQPFAKERWDLHTALKSRVAIPIFGDESIQGPAELERAPEAFGGVNLKLMKCGGTDIAERMAERARELGLQVMLGSMSESSLGCATMLTLQGNADLLDLDGPWLIANDPFEGLRIEDGGMAVTGSFGSGVSLRDDHQLQFEQVAFTR